MNVSVVDACNAGTTVVTSLAVAGDVQHTTAPHTACTDLDACTVEPISETSVSAASPTTRGGDDEEEESREEARDEEEASTVPCAICSEGGTSASNLWTSITLSEENVVHGGWTSYQGEVVKYHFNFPRDSGPTGRLDGRLLVLLNDALLKGLEEPLY